jgi:hypothetical protein
MFDFRSRLMRAAEWGAVLALSSGCGGQTESGSANGGAPGAGATGGTQAGGSGGSGGAIGGSGGTLADAGPDADAGLPDIPYPTPGGCTGPFYDGGYYGQCCEAVGCAAPVNGACPPKEAIAGYLPGYPPGSGSCSCGENKGPFAPHQPGEAACCYLFGSISCEGRPLVVRGRALVAPLRRRSDWATLGLAA